MVLGDETDVFQLRHVMSESKKTVHLYLTVVGEEAEGQVVVNNQFNPTKTNRGRRESQCDGNRSRGKGNEVPVMTKKPKVGMTELQRQNLFEFGEVPEIHDRRCEETSNEGWSDDEYTQRKTAFNPWYCIPSIPDCPEPILEPGPFHSLGPNDKLIIRAFRKCCRKVIIMDGAHLKGKYKGTILHAVAMDGNNQILHIGYGICPKETTDSWTWFLEKLHECIGDVEGLIMVTGTAPAIAISIQNLVRAYKTIEFEFYWQRLRNIRDDVATYLSQIPREKWTRAYCPTTKYDYMTSNSAESMNVVSNKARKLHILPLLEFFRTLMQKWFYKRWMVAEKSTTVLTKWTKDMVKKINMGFKDGQYPVLTIQRIKCMTSKVAA
ncbi:uncharacterized protein LOC122197947 [Lactuca sativa]|uniref:uncharacterized protein LOC122197947 n=1 Tax=Lactuca sativa TaxID=4236 RepID=UPI001C68CD38|nr:uncharacterized protein LOC122197947 [Lactuca sativa]